jgi:hypothetical protein
MKVGVSNPKTFSYDQTCGYKRTPWTYQKFAGHISMYRHQHRHRPVSLQTISYYRQKAPTSLYTAQNDGTLSDLHAKRAKSSGEILKSMRITRAHKP